MTVASTAPAPPTVHYKLVLLGDASVGKSCLVVRFCRGEFYEYQEPTIGAAFMTQTVNLKDVNIKFEIWDTAGQERYRSLAPMYYRGAAAAVVVYDITSADSFAGAKRWITELKSMHSQQVIIGKYLSPHFHSIQPWQGTRQIWKLSAQFQKKLPPTLPAIKESFFWRLQPNQGSM